MCPLSPHSENRPTMLEMDTSRKSVRQIMCVCERLVRDKEQEREMCEIDE